MGAVGIPVRHANSIRGYRGEYDHSICADAGSAITDRLDVGCRPAAGFRAAAIEHDEVIARPAHLVEESSSHSRPTMD
jgi:hypothetical protein